MFADVSELAGTRAMVTGATSGLGAAMAAALSAAGARVVATSRRLARAQAAAQRLGPDAVGVELDVRDEASVSAAVGQVWDLLDGLDVLVNNAGIGMRTVNPRFLADPQPFWGVAPDGFRDVIETKVTGAFLVARAVAPRMVAAGSGRIVTISMSEQTMTWRSLRPVRGGRRSAVTGHGRRSGGHAGDRQPAPARRRDDDRHGSRGHAA
jgi:NAD(P)-dependent dehydrogenase (short-subunit alcohol dehydrogenase family)